MFFKTGLAGGKVERKLNRNDERSVKVSFFHISFVFTYIFKQRLNVHHSASDQVLFVRKVLVSLVLVLLTRTTPQHFDYHNIMISSITFLYMRLYYDLSHPFLNYRFYNPLLYSFPPDLYLTQRSGYQGYDYRYDTLTFNLKTP